MKIRYLLSIFLFCCSIGAADAIASKPTVPVPRPQNHLLADTDSLPTAPIASGRLLMSYLQLPLVAENSSPPLSEGLWHITIPEIPSRLQKACGKDPVPVPDLSDMIAEVDLARRVLTELQYRRLDLFAYSRTELEPFGPDYSYIKSQDMPLINGGALSDRIIQPGKIRGIELKPRYWFFNMETMLQFSQNYISENWYKGGSSNLNIMFSNLIVRQYRNKKIRWKNELENKLSIFNAAKDTVNRYRVAEDLLRLRSNFGYKAFKQWYYSLDAEMRTQLFTNRAENSLKKQSAFLAPIIFNTGLGMKYELDTKSKKVYGKSAKLGLFLSPVSYILKWSVRDDIDLARHGFPEGKTIVHELGSAIKAELVWNFDSRLSWQSRLYANTTYDNTVAEFENALNLSLTRLLSTRLYLYLRYDDSVSLPEGKGTYWQVNELVSIGLYFRL
ncbi:DUF3078 domain-containing protein [Porphyromonas gulae]|uniref:DUF3078 domain-containing protein n=1 Tax=Porphyromonas gulae TaxID=111105 RepID=UPI0006188E72|nr:DUF3078 domain-containing protein [Porphyromonas gulae]KKC50592.1 hypothetical protein HR10_08555 [Porphyromonas gulae]